jgi:hypothetical protein
MILEVRGLDPRYLKLVIGLALESALIHGQNVETLKSLYIEPDLEEVKDLHEKWISSMDHRDRAMAIWLELAIEQDPIGEEPQSLAKEMREMEYLLFNLISGARGAEAEINNWMNYIANASQSLLDGYWIDAKILLSLALKQSQEVTVNRLKEKPEFNYKLDVLQKATLSYFQEIRTYPLSLNIPQNIYNPILEIQKIIFSLMDTMKGRSKEINSHTREAVHRLSSSIRHFLEESYGKVKRDINLASIQIEEILKNNDLENPGFMRSNRQILKEITLKITD